MTPQQARQGISHIEKRIMVDALDLKDIAEHLPNGTDGIIIEHIKAVAETLRTQEQHLRIILDHLSRL